MLAEPGSIEQEVRWWEEADLKERWNGVFQGGGAKGIAYVGALSAVHKADCWFRAVAGSSAGAITAVLIAAGIHPDRMEKLSADGLGSVRKTKLWRHVVGLTGAGVPLYETSDLKKWLDDELGRQVIELQGARSADGDVTFEELYGASGIELFVVTLDVDGGAPVVLSHHNAPDAQVAWAAIASSAIPVAMRRQLLILSDGHGNWRASRMFDGGGWANYPRFVFADPSFRAHAGLPEVEEETRTVGFALDVVGEEEVELTRPSRFVDRPQVQARIDAPTPQARRFTAARLVAAVSIGAAVGLAFGVLLGGSLQLALVGALVAGLVLLVVRRQLSRGVLAVMETIAGIRGLRVAALAVVLLLFGLAIANFEQIDGLFETTPETDETGGWATTLGFILTLVAPYAIVFVFVAILLMLRFQAFLAEDATAVFGATLGAATRLPAWAGAGRGDHLIVVPVDPAIDTTDFVLEKTTRDAVIENAEKRVRARVTQILSVGPGETAPVDPAIHSAAGDAPAPSTDEIWPPEQPMTMWTWIWLAGLLVLVLGIFGCLLFLNSSIDGDPYPERHISVALLIVGAVWSFVAYLKMRQQPH